MSGDASGGYRTALRSRDLRLMLGAFVIDETGGWAYATITSVYIYGRTGSTGWVAALVSSRLITGLVLSGPAGVLADRYERTKLLTVCSFASAVVMALLTVVVAVDGSLAAIIGVSVAATVVGAPIRSASGALVPNVVPEKDLAAANALYATLENLVVVLGPAIGGLLLVAGSPALGLGFNAATSVVAGVFNLMLRVRSTGSATPGESILGQMAEGWRALTGSRVAFVLVLFMTLDSAVFGASSVLYGPLSVHLGTGIEGYSYLVASGALGGVLGAGLANRLAARSALAPVIMGGMLVESLPIAVLGFVGAPVAAAALLVVFGAGMVTLDVVAITALQRDVPRELLGRVHSIMMSFVLGAISATGFVASGLLAATSLRTALVIVGVGIPLLALLGLPVVVRQDRTSAAAVAALEPRIALLEQLGLFAGAGRAALEQLARAATDVTAPAGTVLIRQYEPADAIYLLSSGRLAITVEDAAGERFTRPDVVAPGYVGELGVLRGIPRTATVTAADNSTLVRILANDFSSALSLASASGSLMSMAGERFWRPNTQETAAAPGR